ncbi:hypothetical protein ACFC8F_17765 [Streptomyces hydrogenans]|uniref:hypothetical protein n=1 Tax=Streptomyces hydrogenans TaxID=1873719 RepID=UPI0035D6B21B
MYDSHDIEVHCSRCGSNDTDVEPGDGEVKQGRCLRCEKDFQATPCPFCGSYRVEGSYGISVGVRYSELVTTVDCKDCRSEIPARDPGPETPSER